MWELDYKESWSLKNWCFSTVVLEKTLESLLGCKEIQPVHPKGDESWVFIGRTDAKAKTPILWPPHVRSWLIGKDSDAGKDWGQEEKGTTEDEMAGWHHWLNGRESGWTPGDGNGQGGLACCDSWGCKETDTTEQLNWTELIVLCLLNGHKDTLLFSCFIVLTLVSCGSVGKESACNAGDPDSIPGLGRSTGEGIGYPLQYSGLKNSMDCLVHEGSSSVAIGIIVNNGLS